MKYKELTITGQIYEIHNTKKLCKIKINCNSILFTTNPNECSEYHLGDKVLIKVKYSADDIFIKQKAK